MKYVPEKRPQVSISLHGVTYHKNSLKNNQLQIRLHFLMKQRWNHTSTEAAKLSSLRHS
jgi:hypothetical protein